MGLVGDTASDIYRWKDCWRIRELMIEVEAPLIVMCQSDDANQV